MKRNPCADMPQRFRVHTLHMAVQPMQPHSSTTAVQTAVIAKHPLLNCILHMAHADMVHSHQLWAQKYGRLPTVAEIMYAEQSCSSANKVGYKVRCPGSVTRLPNKANSRMASSAHKVQLHQADAATPIRMCHQC
jgi:hypothetical protein